MLESVVEANYLSGDDYVIEFQDHRFGFNAEDFEERVTAAAVTRSSKSSALKQKR